MFTLELEYLYHCTFEQCLFFFNSKSSCVTFDVGLIRSSIKLLSILVPFDIIHPTLTLFTSLNFFYNLLFAEWIENIIMRLK